MRRWWAVLLRALRALRDWSEETTDGGGSKWR
jgi:hypothetical protein